MFNPDQLDIIAELCLKTMNEIKISFKLDNLTDEEKGIALDEVTALRAITTEALSIDEAKEPSDEKRILLVDDTESIRMILKGILASCGYTSISSAMNGKEAVEKIEKSYFHFDLILCDWEMPVMNGLEFLKYVRKDPKNKNTPFIMVTARNSKDYFKAAMEKGATAYIVKPINQKLVEKRIKSILG